MNWDQINGDWKQFSGKVKEQWGSLTDIELTTIAGQREQMIGVLQKRYGYAKEQAEKEIREFTHGLARAVTSEKPKPSYMSPCWSVLSAKSQGDGFR